MACGGNENGACGSEKAKYQRQRKKIDMAAAMKSKI
jgi:hypothetical protein